MNAQEILKQYFGYSSFKEGQESIINSILEGQDSLAIMPTGAGKSICYQVPALMLQGITVVISPLISLMQDQVKALNSAGVRAAYINSSLTETQITTALGYAAQGTYKIIYVAPERLETWEFINFARSADISMVTVDEAHCISQWGQDFRPSYLKIVDFVNSLSKRPIISAFTATATEEVKTDIECILGLRDPNVVVTGFDRENLYYRVETIKQKNEFVLEYIQTHPEESGIIYCATRKNVDSLYELLLEKGVSVTKYHAGMDNESRKNNQDDFIYDRISVIVATNAFGMGIDKSNVRFVIHYNMPQSMENYYQEAGRAGRDGEASQCILLFSAQDIMINKFLLEHKDFSEVSPEDIEPIQQRDMHRLMVMEGYCKTTGCLRNYILNYFGEETGSPCDNCGNCHREYQEVDMTEEAKSVVNCVFETKGRYGQAIVIGTLLGANRARLKELGTVNYKTYGALKDKSEPELKNLISQMISSGYLIQTEDQYSVLRLGDISPLKSSDTKVIIRTYEEKEITAKSKKKARRSTDSLTSAGYDLFEALRKLRTEIAREESLPPYIIFSDKSLIDMCVKAPRTKDEMLNVSGVGTAKYEKYGGHFLGVIQVFMDKHPNCVLSIDDGEFSEKPVKKKTKMKKTEFYLESEDVVNFQYAEKYFISDIKDELNRICTAQDVKKVSATSIWKYLVDEGYTLEANHEGVFKKEQTQKGLAAGIETVFRTSTAGTEYTLLVYPQMIQKMIVQHFVSIKSEVLSSVESEVTEQSQSNRREEYNKLHNKPIGAGQAWNEEEDAKLRAEFESGMSIADIAKNHDRTSGAIFARLRKHGLIE